MKGTKYVFWIRYQVEDLRLKVVQLESDIQLLLESKINLGKQVQDLTDELIELREKYSQPADPEEVITVQRVRVISFVSLSPWEIISSDENDCCLI